MFTQHVIDQLDDAQLFQLASIANSDLLHTMLQLAIAEQQEELLNLNTNQDDQKLARDYTKINYTINYLAEQMHVLDNLRKEFRNVA